MEGLLNQQRSYKFHFWKDKFWIWLLVLPFGLICWAIPFVLFIGLTNTSNSPDWFPYFGFFLLGIPGYWIGWIFVYSLMEGFYTKVTLTASQISIRLPWLIFPIIPITKRIAIEKVFKVDLFARYGTRTAVFLFYRNQHGRERRFYLPLFMHDPAYGKEMLALRDRIMGLSDQPSEVTQASPDDAMPGKTERMQTGKFTRYLPPSPIERFIRFLYLLVLVGIFAISAWITSTVPPGGITAVEIGFSIAFVASLIGLVGLLPIIGQILIWFFGRAVITWAANLFTHLSTDDISWTTPDAVNVILAQFNLKPIHATFTDFLFWSVLIFSSLISLDRLIGWPRRRMAGSVE